MFPILRYQPCVRYRTRWCLTAAVLISTLAACTTPATVSSASDKAAASATKPITNSSASSQSGNTEALRLLQQVDKAVSPQREQLLLQAADIYQAQGDLPRVGRVMVEIDPRTLSGSELLHYSVLYGQWALDKRQLMLAETVLLNPALESVADTELQALRARLYELEQRPLDAIQALLQQSSQSVSTEQQQAINESLWRLLSQLRDEEFLWLETQPQEQLLGGWLALARIQRQGFDNIDKQVADLRDWQRSWPVHPANRFMPADMKLLGGLLDDQPKHIALLLPFTGKHAPAGRAVRDGFLAGYYRGLAAGAPGIQIDMIDSAAAPDILTAYRAAVAQGAQRVIGPLEREQVQVLTRESTLPVPTLALNNPLEASNTPAQLFQFSLNPEDEVRQVAERAWANRHHRAVVIAADNERGERLRQSFVRNWQALGAEVSGHVRYQPDGGNYSMQIAEALGLDLATGQFREGSTLPDMIYFAGNIEDAGSVMQSLARNSAGSVPVYTTSQIHSSNTTAVRARRADGIRLCLSPWQSGTGSLRAAGDTPPADSENLYVMGADAQQLYLRLPLMQANNSLHVSGNAGYLHLDAQRRIERKLTWAVLQDGRPQIMPAVASEPR
jgi:outer membrane PBP1 activator LpoA protein